MTKEHLRQWHDNTADTAIGLADNCKPKLRNSTLILEWPSWSEPKFDPNKSNFRAGVNSHRYLPKKTRTERR